MLRYSYSTPGCWSQQKAALEAAVHVRGSVSLLVSSTDVDSSFCRQKALTSAHKQVAVQHEFTYIEFIFNKFIYFFIFIYILIKHCWDQAVQKKKKKIYNKKDETRREKKRQ